VAVAIADREFYSVLLEKIDVNRFRAFDHVTIVLTQNGDQWGRDDSEDQYSHFT